MALRLWNFNSSRNFTRKTLSQQEAACCAQKSTSRNRNCSWSEISTLSLSHVKLNLSDCLSSLSRRLLKPADKMIASQPPWHTVINCDAITWESVSPGTVLASSAKFPAMPPGMISALSVVVLSSWIRLLHRRTLFENDYKLQNKHKELPNNYKHTKDVQKDTKRLQRDKKWLKRNVKHNEEIQKIIKGYKATTKKHKTTTETQNNY